ncbi:MAG: hypothetical protein D6806_08310 [Deltaproteobacteria bacterium]|nr:MAG: hypothetical protein D6806_08310 [Deltaproteobacteria bacterium]
MADITDDKRTRFAMAAVDFANLFNEVFKSTQIEGYTLSLTAPEGPSTGGGVQSLQHITLQKPGAKALVMGSCDKLGRQAELRNYEQVAAIYAQRTGGEALPLPRSGYDQLLGKVREFLKSQEFRVEMAPLTSTTQPKAGKPSGSGAVWWIVALLVLAALAGAVYYFTSASS